MTGSWLFSRNRRSSSSPSMRGILMSNTARSGGLSISGFSAASPRSEEHTSELQSLMRISYAVFCLKKKTKHLKNDSHLKNKKKIEISENELQTYHNNYHIKTQPGIYITHSS